MIIKKKYTISKSKENTPSKPEGDSVIQNKAVSENSENITKKEEKSAENNEKTLKEDEKTENNAEKNLSSKSNINDFSLSLNEIEFEQRAERREGMRRRGYRRTQDRNIISRAQEDAKSIKETARQEGYKQGIEEANKDIEQLKNKLAEFYGYKNEIFDKVSVCILDISTEIAKKIIGKEMETDKTLILQIIKNALEEVNKTENKIILKVMPQDVEIVKNKIPDIFSSGGYEAAISVIPDKSITEGGVIVETSNGIIDATVKTQMEIIEKVLCKKETGKE